MPRLPKVGEYVRNHGRLIAIEIIPPPPQPLPEKDYIFEETEARCEIRFNDEVINIIQLLNDFYGEGTGAESAIKEMKKYAAERGIGPDSDIEVVVVKITKQIRYRPLSRQSFYDKEFYDFKWLGMCHNLPDPVEVVVWSSKQVAK